MFRKISKQQNMVNGEQLSNICFCFSSLSQDKKKYIEVGQSNKSLTSSKTNIKRSITKQLKNKQTHVRRDSSNPHQNTTNQIFLPLPEPQMTIKQQCGQKKFNHPSNFKHRYISEEILFLSRPIKAPMKVEQFYNKNQNNKIFFHNNDYKVPRKIIPIEIPKYEIQTMKNTYQTMNGKKNIAESLGINTKLVQSQVISDDEQQNSDNYSIVLQKLNNRHGIYQRT